MGLSLIFIFDTEVNAEIQNRRQPGHTHVMIQLPPRDPADFPIKRADEIIVVLDHHQRSQKIRNGREPGRELVLVTEESNECRHKPVGGKNTAQRHSHQDGLDERPLIKTEKPQKNQAPDKRMESPQQHDAEQHPRQFGAVPQGAISFHQFHHPRHKERQEKITDPRPVADRQMGNNVTVQIKQQREKDKGEQRPPVPLPEPETADKSQRVQNEALRQEKFFNAHIFEQENRGRQIGFRDRQELIGSFVKVRNEKGNGFIQQGFLDHRVVIVKFLPVDVLVGDVAIIHQPRPVKRPGQIDQPQNQSMADLSEPPRPDGAKHEFIANRLNSCGPPARLLQHGRVSKVHGKGHSVKRHPLARQKRSANRLDRA